MTGRLELDWDERGGYLLRAVSAQYVVTGVADGATFEQTVHHDGTEVGSWSGSGSEYALAATDSSGLTSVVTLSGAGGEAVFDQSDTQSAPWSGAMTIGCTGSGMTTTVTEASGSLTVAWTRR